ncbi:MAG TPA: acetylxylan esterase, partial [Candidatus Synoicihabitans sp.]|nr:acetylxylan esterase [Candidatus Synoicihabitans sp.]
MSQSLREGRAWLTCIGACCLSAGGWAAVAEPEWLPPDLPPLQADGPTLCPRNYLTPEQGQALLDATLRAFPSLDDWRGYANVVRARIQAGAGLEPWPQRTPLRPRRHSRREFDGYSVEAVAFESLPGFYVTGNLYRPTTAAGRSRPAILSTHGHTPAPRAPGDYERHGRFTEYAQIRAAALARLGAVVLSIDMFGYGDSIVQVGAEAHRTPLAMRVQLWNAIRALDFLTTLDEVDPAQIAVTGESGGATQALLLTAVDPRVAVSVPVVMVSSYFFGGCPCESGRPIHRSSKHFASNAVIAALAAPRPMLVISDGKDWT